MNRRNKELTHKVVALIVIVALLQFVGVSFAMITFLVTVGLFVALIARRAEQRETQRVFAFYIDADEILRNEERGWYGFEIHEVIGDGERAMRSMTDPPVLCYFVVGALCHRVGDHCAAVDYLSPLVDREWVDKRHSAPPSPQLRRYVEFLRELEREPAIAPQALGAVRSLERQRQKHLARLLAESRQAVQPVTVTTQVGNPSVSVATSPFAQPGAPLSSITPPPSIAEVLHEVYQDERHSS